MTPLPWKIVDGEIVGADYLEIVTIDDDGACGDADCCGDVSYYTAMSGEDQLFIVRAVNCHEELLHLLQRVRAFDRHTPLLGTDMVYDIGRAIAKAEGKL